MKKFATAVVAALAITLSACVADQPQPIQTVTPTPWPGDTAGPTPTTTSTPSQEELSAQAEQAYRAFFTEWTRLEREGGADEPTQVLLDNGAGKYLDGVMALLRDQKATGRQVGGAPPQLTVVPAPGGDFEGIDPRLTLQVCEDHREAWFEDQSGRRAGQLVQGTVYLGFVDGRIKATGASTKVVDRCTL